MPGDYWTFVDTVVTSWAFGVERRNILSMFIDEDQDQNKLAWEQWRERKIFMPIVDLKRRHVRQFTGLKYRVGGSKK